MKTLFSGATSFLAAVVGIGLCAAGARAQVGQLAEASCKGMFNHLRTGPDSHHPIFMSVEQGTRFTVVGETDQFKEVVLADGTRGWIYYKNVHYLGIPSNIVDTGAPPTAALAPHVAVVDMERRAPAVTTTITRRTTVRRARVAVRPTPRRTVTRVARQSVSRQRGAFPVLTARRVR